MKKIITITAVAACSLFLAGNPALAQDTSNIGTTTTTTSTDDMDDMEDDDDDGGSWGLLGLAGLLGLLGLRKRDAVHYDAGRNPNVNR